MTRRARLVEDSRLNLLDAVKDSLSYESPCPRCGGRQSWIGNVLRCSSAVCRRTNPDRKPPTDPATVSGPLRQPLENQDAASAKVRLKYHARNRERWGTQVNR